MLNVLLIIQVIIAVSMVGIILLQRTNSDGVSGLGGGSSGGNSLFSGRTSANLLTRTTTILAASFMINCLVMAGISAHKANLVYDFSPSKSAAKADKNEKDKIDNKKLEDNKNPSAPIPK